MTLVIVDAEAPAGATSAHAATLNNSNLFTVFPPLPIWCDRSFGTHFRIAAALSIGASRASLRLTCIAAAGLS
jgi:hypothetical protein